MGDGLGCGLLVGGNGGNGPRSIGFVEERSSHLVHMSFDL